MIRCKYAWPSSEGQAEEGRMCPVALRLVASFLLWVMAPSAEVYSYPFWCIALMGPRALSSPRNGSWVGDWQFPSMLAYFPDFPAESSISFSRLVKWPKAMAITSYDLPCWHPVGFHGRPGHSLLSLSHICIIMEPYRTLSHIKLYSDSMAGAITSRPVSHREMKDLPGSQTHTWHVENRDCPWHLRITSVWPSSLMLLSLWDRRAKGHLQCHWVLEGLESKTPEHYRKEGVRMEIIAPLSC